MSNIKMDELDLLVELSKGDEKDRAIFEMLMLLDNYFENESTKQHIRRLKRQLFNDLINKNQRSK